MKSEFPGLQRYARLAICASFVLAVPQMNAATSRSCPASTGIDTPDSASSITPAASAPEPKPASSEKYDVDRIGERNTGKGINIYSMERERALGQSMADAIAQQTKFVTDPKIVEYVNRLAQKIIVNSDAQVAFTIKVIDSPDVKTFALPGGFLYVDKGLLGAVENEAELVGLIAHEIGHVAARHGTRYATRKYAWNMLAMPIVYMTGPASIGAQQIGPLAMRKFAREAELEADLLGMEYQFAAGYDPQAFVEALERLNSWQIQKDAQKLQNAGKGGFFSHLPFKHQIIQSYAYYPPIEERIQRLQREIETMLPCHDAYVTDTSEFEEVRAQFMAQELVLRRDHAQDGGVNGPVLRRHPSSEWQGPLEVQSFITGQANPYSF
jgi:Zn-dependent protease with chaperone function